MSVSKLCALDPVTTVNTFFRRFEALMKVLIPVDKQKKPVPGPLGLIEHHFYRVEYQARGAPHVHMKVPICSQIVHF